MVICGIEALECTVKNRSDFHMHLGHAFHFISFHLISSPIRTQPIQSSANVNEKNVI